MLNAYVSGPLARHLFSDRSSEFQETFGLAITYVSVVALTVFSGRPFAQGVNSRSIILQSVALVVANHERKVGDTVAVIV